jgi:hypothetical protein
MKLLSVVNYNVTKFEKVFNLIKLIRFKYFRVVKLLKIEELREELGNMKDNLIQTVDEYAIHFKKQFDNHYKNLITNLDTDRLKTNYNTIRADSFDILQEDIKTKITQDIEYTKFVGEGLFMNHYKLIVDHVQTLSKDGAINNYLTEIIDEVKQLKKYLENIHNQGKSILDYKKEKRDINSILSKYFAKFNLNNLHHYLKFGSRLLIALEELKNLYNTKLEFTDNKILLKNISYFEIIETEGTQVGKRNVVSMKLFGYKSKENVSLDFALGPSVYEDIKKPIASLQFTIIKYMLYFGKKIEAANKKLVYCDLGKCDENNSIDIHEKNSLIFSSLESR